jgi:hypothetical protein
MTHTHTKVQAEKEITQQEMERNEHLTKKLNDKVTMLMSFHEKLHQERGTKPSVRRGDLTNAEEDGLQEECDFS